MSKRTKPGTEQGYGREWIPPAAQEAMRQQAETPAASVDEAFGEAESQATPDSGVEGFAPLLEPSELPAIIPEPLPPPELTDAEIIESLRASHAQALAERDEFQRRVFELESQVGPMLDRAAQLANEITVLMGERDQHVVESDRLNYTTQQLTDELGRVREQLAVTHLEGSRHQEEATQLRSNIDVIGKSMLFQVYPRRGGNPRVFIVAKDLSDALKKFVESGGKHEEVANVSMVADKLLL